MTRVDTCNPWRQKFVLFLLLFMVSFCNAQQIPERPMPPRLVNDFTNTLTKNQQYNLEQKLVAYNDTTSTQIAVVFVNDLQGTTAADFAYQLGEKWGVGTKDNNGIVVLVKPKTDTKGEVFISVGYGLESYIPDAMAKRIIENEMIPSFRNNDYYSGVDDATDMMIKLASGSFSADEYSSSDDIFILIFFIIMMAAMITFITFAGKVGKTYSTRHDSSSIWKVLFWASVFSNGNHRNHNHWGGFSGNSGGFGGSGSFGGFGGGHFGGGGAGGSW